MFNLQQELFFFWIDQASLDLLARFYTKRRIGDPSAKTAWICVLALRVNLPAWPGLLLSCPSWLLIVFPVMNTTSDTINDYIKALRERANQVGGLDYALGYLHSTLTQLKLQSYELEQLQKDTENLRDLVAEDNIDLSTSIL
jgi:hypothetical protein